MVTIEQKRERIMYGWLGAWVLIMLAAVVFMKFGDPTSGHAGHLVFPDERTVELRPVPLGRTFRVAKDDHIVRMNAVPTRSQSNAWIRITAGTHEGRTGVIVW